MPLGIVNKEQFESELNRFRLPIKSELEINVNQEIEPIGEIVDQSRGRGNKSEVPDVIRRVIADEALNGASVDELSESFNVSPSSISAYKHGAHSTSSYNNPNSELKKHVNNIRDKIVRKANNRIIDALNSITRESLTDLKPRDLSAIAKDLSGVVKNLTPETTEINNDVKVVVMAPPMKAITAYDVIPIEE